MIYILPEMHLTVEFAGGEQSTVGRESHSADSVRGGCFEAGLVIRGSIEAQGSVTRPGEQGGTVRSKCQVYNDIGKTAYLPDQSSAGKIPKPKTTICTFLVYDSLAGGRCQDGAIG